MLVSIENITSLVCVGDMMGGGGGGGGDCDLMLTYIPYTPQVFGSNISMEYSGKVVRP